VNAGVEIGATLVGYRVEMLLGRGGMGSVYRAEHVALGRKVALKVLAPELTDNKEFRSRFMLESRSAARLEHPNIIPIYEAGEADGRLYIAMRYVAGRDLGALIANEGPLAPQRTVDLLSQVANALDAAHHQGMVHRDVKPANILIDRLRRPNAPEHAWLCDFGLVKPFAAPAEQRLTATGVFMGTIQYVAPEQIEGRELNGQTDVYALGCVLYECLTGRLPFERDSDVATLYAHLHDPPPTIEGRPELDAVLTTAMAKSRAERFRNCDDLVRAARVAVAGGRRPPPTEPAGYSADRIPTAERSAPPLRPGPRPPHRSPETPPTPVRITRPVAVPRRAPDGPRRRRVRGLVRSLFVILVLLAVVAGIYATGLVPWFGGGDRVACVNNFSVPTVGTPLRVQPLDAIRDRMDIDGRFVVTEMRTFAGSDGTRWWYVKATRQDDLDFNGRWLVRDGSGGAEVVAAAPYDSLGFTSPEWRGFRGTGPLQTYTGLPGSWAGPDYDFVTEGGLPPEVQACMDGT
jgi:tRNA A-37 threonylcarbamoyl transferase component Bud32